MNLSLPLLALVVICASVTDLRHHRISNWLCLAALICGIAVQISVGAPFWGVVLSVVVPFLVLIPFYALGGMAAGDVKLMTGCGALLGWPLAALGVGLTLVVGAVLGAAIYLARGGWSDAVARARYGFAARVLFSTGHLFLERAPADSVAASRFPYAVAIAVGSLGAALYPLI